MRYRRLQIGRMGPFQSVDIDLDAIAGTLIAVVGPNGAGKTVMLQLLTEGAAYRRTSTRGTLAHLATARDSFVEVSLVANKPWTIRQTVDCISGKGEALVLDAEGVPAFSDGKVTSHGAWAKANLPPIEVMHASSVSVQKSGGFLDLGRGERMAALLRIIGAEHLEAKAEAARKHATQTRTTLDTQRARLADAEAQAVDVALAETGLAAAEREATRRATASEAAHEALRRAEVMATDSQAAQEVRARRKASVDRVAAARAEVADVEVRQGNNRGLVADAAEIRAAVARDAELAALETEHRAEAERLGTVADGLQRESAASAAALRRAQDGMASAERDRRRALARLEDKPIVDAATGAAATQRERVAEHEAAVSGAAPALEALQRSRLSHKDDRIDGMRKGLTEIRDDIHHEAPEGGRMAAQCANAYLADDDAHVEAFEDLPATIAAAEQDLDDSRKALKLAQSLLGGAEKQAARSGEMTAAADDLVKADAELDEHLRWEAKLAPESREKFNEAAAAADLGKIERSKLRHCFASRATLEPLLKRARRLDDAETRLEELARTHAALTATLASHEAELAELPEAPEDGGVPDVGRYKRDTLAAAEVAKSASVSVGACRTRVERGKADAEKVAALKSETGALEVELADWRKLAADLGRDGLQALEVDTAVPTLNVHVNQLLGDCYGDRFAVTIKTDRLSADGKKTREAIDVRIIDNLKGRDDLAESLSGGEGAIVGEALALGLTVLGCECAGIDEPDLVRDETGAALDAENRDAYCAMLRKAAEMVGARHVFMVSHDADTIAAADARIVISKDGTVEVQHGG